MKQHTSLPRGTRDFGPEVMMRRNFILDNIREVFTRYGFLPLETPAMENLSVLEGKYGEEGDRLLFKILNSGDFLRKSSIEDRKESSSLVSKITDKGLRYDLTVPFARFVASNRHNLALPFKRYQIQPVWRADRPQKGRYREFYQCDADVVGTKSLICETEIVLMINEVLQKLGVTDFSIKVNHRKILEGVCEFMGTPGQLSDLSVGIDKLDKIGWEGVKKELGGKGFSEDSIEKLATILKDGQSREKINSILTGTSASDGFEEFNSMKEMLSSFELENDHVQFDISLARGLAYYTGMIFEVIIADSGVGSVSGGGRYDDLTGVFGVEEIPGVGFSFGIDRLYDAMEHLDLFPVDDIKATEVLIVHFDDECFRYGLGSLKLLREAGIASEIYPDSTKLRKQLGYADKKGIRQVIIIGSEEMKTGNLTLKSMETGEEKSMGVNEIIRTLTTRNG